MHSDPDLPLIKPLDEHDTEAPNPLDELKDCDTTKRIMMLIENHEQQLGYIDIRQMAGQLKFEIQEVRFSNSTDIAVMSKDSEGNKKITLSEVMTTQEQNSVMAWLIADYLLKNRELKEKRPIRCNIFVLREFRMHRYSRTMLLATRLTMTESAIEKMSELDNRHLQRDLCRHITPEFANAAVKGHSVSFLIGNDYI